MSDARFCLPRWFVALAGVMALSLGVVVPAQAQLGKASALFLRIEPDSRSAGMGNTGVAVADDANAMFWNPAGLGFQRNTQVGVTHANWLPEFDAGLFYEYLVGTYHVGGVGTFGGNVTFLNLGTTERRGGDGQNLGETSSYELAVGVSYGRQVSDRLSLGTNLRYIHSKLVDPTSQLGIEDGSASTAAFDLGGLYRSPSFALGGSEANVSVGLNFANMGGFMQYESQKQPLPMNMRFGYALTIDFDEYNSLTFANDFTKSLVHSDTTAQGALEPDPFYKSFFTSWGTSSGQVIEDEVQELNFVEQFTLGTGLEYWYSDLFALRSGYYYEDPNNGGREFLNFGAGLRYNIVGVDISYIYTLERDSPLANTLRFSLLFEFQ